MRRREAQTTKQGMKLSGTVTEILLLLILHSKLQKLLPVVLLQVNIYPLTHRLSIPCKSRASYFGEPFLSLASPKNDTTYSLALHQNNESTKAVCHGHLCPLFPFVFSHFQIRLALLLNLQPQLDDGLKYPKTLPSWRSADREHPLRRRLHR